jgi:hypothetical protein
VYSGEYDICDVTLSVYPPYSSLFISLEIDYVDSLCKHGNICIAGLNRRAGYATACKKAFVIINDFTNLCFSY